MPADHRFVLTLSCPDRTGIVARITTLPGRDRWLDHRGRIPLGQRVRPVLHPAGDQGRLGGFTAADLRPGSGRWPSELAADSWQVTDSSRPQDGRAAGLQGRPLPVRTAVPLAFRRDGGRHRGRHRQSPRPGVGRQDVRTAVPAHPGAQRRQGKGRGVRGGQSRGRPARARTRSCWPGTCRSSRPSCASAGRAG